MNKKFLFLILLSVLVVPSAAFAQTITGMADAAVNTTLLIASAIVVILWVVTGLLFLTAQGAPEKLTQGKKALFAAVAGTVIVIVATGAIGLVRQAFGL